MFVDYLVGNGATSTWGQWINPLSQDLTLQQSIAKDAERMFDSFNPFYLRLSIY